MLDKIRSRLRDLGMENLDVQQDEKFDTRMRELVRVTIGDAYWHLFPQRLWELVDQLSPDDDREVLKRRIEEEAVLVWHGPSPKSRDTSP